MINARAGSLGLMDVPWCFGTETDSRCEYACVYFTACKEERRKLEATG